MNYSIIAIIFILLITTDIQAKSAATHNFNCTAQQPILGVILDSTAKNTDLASILGCQIKTVIPLSPAWYSKLRAGDWIVEINKVRLKQQKYPCDLLKKTLKKSLSDVVALKIKNDFSQQNMNINLAQKFKLNRAIVTNHSESVNCLSSLSVSPVLPNIKQLQAKPLLFASRLENMQQQIQQLPQSLASLSQFLFSFSYKNPPHVAQILALSIDNKDLIKSLKQFLKTSYKLSSEAFKSITKTEQQFFIKNYLQLSTSILQSQQLINETNRQNLEIIVALFKIAARLDFEKLNDAAQNWYQLTQQDWSTLNFPKQPQIVASPYGHIIIGSYADDIYDFSQPIAIIIDPGGNDQYINKSTNSSLEKTHILNTAIIDLAGDDLYQSSAGKGFASAILGISLLFDKQGNDSYQGGLWSQASAFAGASALYDLAGDDSYQAEAFSQSTALFGYAILLDNKGNDFYQIKHHGQGLGLAYGHAVLFDNSGNDSYQSLNGLPSTYANTPSSWESWAQGCGKGFRYILPGGIGLLVDKQGQDVFKAGEFAQGNGYYFGMGLLFNLGSEDDHYQGTRYTMGTAAHQAIAGFVDMAGNDNYKTTGPAFCGSGWDQSISYFFDAQGDDCYSSVDFSFAATMHSISTFKDTSGKDQIFFNKPQSCFLK
ncbi:MAG: hypothetical protein QM479_14875 [Pseudomonadota bacterium]